MPVVALFRRYQALPRVTAGLVTAASAGGAARGRGRSEKECRGRQEESAEKAKARSSTSENGHARDCRSRKSRAYR